MMIDTAFNFLNTITAPTHGLKVKVTDYEV